MTLMINAVYENGILRPLTPLNLPENARVALQIQDAPRDPFLELVGIASSEQPLIDNIPVSEDPDLYLTAAELNVNVSNLHAWEIAPARYKKGPNNQPQRII